MTPLFGETKLRQAAESKPSNPPPVAALVPRRLSTSLQAGAGAPRRWEYHGGFIQIES